MDSFDSACIQAMNLANVLDGTINASFLKCTAKLLDEDDPYRVTCLMGLAISLNDPIKVFQLAGCYNFGDENQKTIAFILMECAAEMMKEMDFQCVDKENEKEVQVEKTVAQVEHSTPMRLTGRRRMNRERDLRFNLTHNLRQAVSRYIRRNNNQISDIAIKNFSMQYSEEEDNVKGFCEQMINRNPRKIETKKRAKRTFKRATSGRKG